jgi:RNA polymerase sigma-70 factor (ECF subfamily)
MNGLVTEDVWRRTNGDLFAFFRRRVRDEHTANDLLQETFVRVHRGLETLDDEERLGAWVFRIARRVLAEKQRGERNSEDVDDHDVPDEREPAPNQTAVVASWLRPMMSLLPPEHREALELAEIEGLSQQAIAERLGLSLSGAKSRVQRGRAALREVVEACCRVDFDRRGQVLDWERREGGCTSCE